jgi:hypothetical protein
MDALQNFTCSDIPVFDYDLSMEKISAFLFVSMMFLQQNCLTGYIFRLMCLEHPQKKSEWDL